ncbi:MAG TPA: phosphopantothenoylcysteine decarboxylase [Verrucomicrobiota bacterium]|jgi:phosphopantothenoylcysteine decarboxylase/phosphopantothenate--cysteine ligase|nr:DNA/pantothenate metabolism flavoprotein domain protein [Verrucomicrobiota bacterium]OQC23750.1 MAG: Coenzyme A biosynthesis bifunctional protein CoaBC [Verrucomicrobia bacterium ADurb.Bin063]HRR65883.1 phosphopantothenoylcysteine decarboxylase [Candidatus Paceibacterota bacterium]MBP8016352.1 DNA/pantothenate metabolism flavoprotein domain protein [Verrucomicrobiota bacterium]MDI9372141.1 phosphopantothenoylcysteine decarboxylase [Verrucomicrobiota bacterium]
MRCVVTAGPTFEPLDAVRRLTNFSTGRLGSELADFLAARGHDVTLLRGEQATWRGEVRARRVQTFTTTADLRARLQALAGPAVAAVFHAAAVSDYTFGRVWNPRRAGRPAKPGRGKLASRHGPLLARLVPTPKIIADLRAWFPRARLVGWKYEVEGGRARALRRAARQLAEYHTDGCVANGPAYGAGFGLVRADGSCLHLADAPALFAALEAFLRPPPAAEPGGAPD